MTSSLEFAGWRRKGDPLNMGDLPASSRNALKTTHTRSLLMRPVFLDVEVGDVVAVNPPHDAAYLAEVMYV